MDGNKVKLSPTLAIKGSFADVFKVVKKNKEDKKNKTCFKIKCCPSRRRGSSPLTSNHVSRHPQKVNNFDMLLQGQYKSPGIDL